ncbi:MAG TPA: hypothetical protein VFA12_20070 [Stellaceae bacterium]|nr:hypothetical protein [Stellaceae bacterium]
MDVRHDALLAELEARGWLAGAFHQTHYPNGAIVLSFGGGEDGGETATIAVFAIPDRHAFSNIRGRITRNAVKGEGYGLAFAAGGRRLDRKAATASEAVDVMEEWRANLSEAQRETFGA